jgi:hypothetical protein
VAGSLPHARALLAELGTFHVKAPTVGAEVDAWREREHDDLVLALAVSLWYAERHAPALYFAEPLVVVPGRDPSQWW